MTAETTLRLSRETQGIGVKTGLKEVKRVDIYIDIYIYLG